MTTARLRGHKFYAVSGIIAYLLDGGGKMFHGRDRRDEAGGGSLREGERKGEREREEEGKTKGRREAKAVGGGGRVCVYCICVCV